VTDWQKGSEIKRQTDRIPRQVDKQAGQPKDNTQKYVQLGQQARLQKDRHINNQTDRETNGQHK
jgi:hypothetical protein